MSNKEKIEAFIEEAKKIAEKHGLSGIFTAYTYDPVKRFQIGGDVYFTEDIKNSPSSLISYSASSLAGVFLHESHNRGIPDDITFSAALTKTIESHTKAISDMFNSQTQNGDSVADQPKEKGQKEKANGADEVADEFIRMINNFKK